MQKISILVAIAATTGVALAQNPRTPVKVDTATLAEFPSVASNGDLSAVLYQDMATEGLFVTTSDGRGIDWSSPERIDDKVAVTGNFIDTRESLRVSNGNIYACWRDERLSTDDDLFFTYSTDGGTIWATNVEVDKGFVSGGNPVRTYAFDVDGDNAAFLISTDNGDEELYLVTSTSISTGSMSAAFSATLLNGTGDTDSIALDVDGDLVHFAFTHDSTGANQVYYSTYDLATATFLTQDLLISTNVQAAAGDATGTSTEISASGATAFVAWDTDDVNGTQDEIWVNAITGGVAIGDVQVGGYAPGVDDCDNPAVLLNGDMAIVTWEDNRTGGDEAYAVSADISGGSLTFGAEVAVSSGGAGFPSIAGSGDYVAITATAGGFPEDVQGVVSRDGGMNFGSSFTMAASTSDVDFAEVAYNELYDNFVISFLSDDIGTNECFVGGFRTQTIDAVGTFMPGQMVNFDASNFGASEDGQFFGVLASASIGGTLAPDGRNLGLTQDTFFARTRDGIPGDFSGTLTAGAGSTPMVTLPNLAPGTTIYFVAIGFDSMGDVYSLTDVNSVVTL